MHAYELLPAIAFGFLAALPGCRDHKHGVLSQPRGTKTFYACTACLTDDSTRCATNTPACGDLPERTDSEVGAKDALCETLTAAELARRPVPTGFKPSPYFKTACYEWPSDAFKISCTTFTKACESVPIH